MVVLLSMQCGISLQFLVHNIASIIHMTSVRARMPNLTLHTLAVKVWLRDQVSAGLYMGLLKKKQHVKVLS